MYVYSDINTQIIVCIQISYHSCKSYINTHIKVRINKINTHIIVSKYD